MVMFLQCTPELIEQVMLRHSRPFL